MCKIFLFNPGSLQLRVGQKLRVVMQIKDLLQCQLEEVPL